MAQPNQYFATQIQSANPVAAFQQGRQFDQQNTLAQQQGVLFQQAQQDRVKAQQNDTLFKNALVKFLGPVNAGMVTGDAGLSPTPQPVPTAPGPAGGEMQPGATPGYGGGGDYAGGNQNALAQMLQANPEQGLMIAQFQQHQQALAAQQAQAMHEQQAALQKKQGTEAYNSVNWLESQSKEYGVSIKSLLEHGFKGKPGYEHLREQYGDKWSEVTDADLKPWLANIKSQGAQMAGIAPEKEKEGFTLNQGDVRFDAKGNKIASVAPKTSSQEAAESGLAPEDVDVAAGVVMLDPARMHDYATFGKQGQAIRTEINKAITKKLTDANMTTGGLAKLRSNFVAQKGSIKKMTDQSNMIEAFEGVAKYNGDRVLELIDKIDDTGVPFIEGITRKLKKGAGDVDAAEAQSVMTAFQTEAARILNNPNLSGVLSDSARHETQDMINGKMSAAQTKRVIKRIFAEMDVRKGLINQQIGTASGSMAGETPIAGAPAPAAGLPADIAALLAKHGAK